MIDTDEGLTLETSVFKSFMVANLPYQPCGQKFTFNSCFTFPLMQPTVSFETKSPKSVAGKQMI